LEKINVKWKTDRPAPRARQAGNREPVNEEFHQVLGFPLSVFNFALEVGHAA